MKQYWIRRYNPERGGERDVYQVVKKDDYIRVAEFDTRSKARNWIKEQEKYEALKRGC